MSFPQASHYSVAVSLRLIGWKRCYQQNIPLTPLMRLLSRCFTLKPTNTVASLQQPPEHAWRRLDSDTIFSYCSRRQTAANVTYTMTC